MQYTLPSSSSAYWVFCSNCDYHCFGAVHKVEPDKYEKWLNHKCSLFCFSDCPKHFILDEKRTSEFYVLEESKFICYKCIKTGEFDSKSYRPFWKIPKNATYRFNYSMKRDPHDIREKYPFLFEDSWYSGYYCKLMPVQQAFDDIVLDYKMYLELKSLKIVL
jgi:hypothetical protein